MIKYIIHSLAIVILTILTQVGGLIYLLTVVLGTKYRLSKFKIVRLFSGIYLIATIAIIPAIAPKFGRVALPMTGNLKPLTILTYLCNRHYVNRPLADMIINLSNQMAKDYPGTQTNYLDANFPFIDGFPLFPHLSHDDGKKIDLAFYYKLTDTNISTNSSPSILGYGVYDAPVSGEENYPNICNEKGYWQYGLLTALIPKWFADKYTTDVDRTRSLIEKLANEQLTEKIFIEPHLKKRWNLESENKIRFHGCQAVRHDDHIHIQMNPNSSN